MTQLNRNTSKIEYWIYLCIANAFGLLYLGCAPAPDVVAARLVTGLLTKLPASTDSTNPVPASTSLPGQVSCNSDVYTISSGTVAGTGTLSGETVTATFRVMVNAKGSGITASTGTSTSDTAALTVVHSEENDEAYNTYSQPNSFSDRAFLDINPYGQGSNFDSTSTSGSTGASAAGPAYSLYCNFSGTWGYDSTSGQLKGTGKISTCDHFDCIVNGKKVECNKLSTNFAATTCY